MKPFAQTQGRLAGTLLLVGGLVLAACSSSGGAVTTVLPPTVPPVTLLPATSTASSASTESTPGAAGSATLASTASVSATTPVAASTSAATAAAAGTSVLSATAPVTSTGALLITTDALIGLPVVDNAGHAAGAVSDVLVDISGTIQSIVVDLAPAQAGTPPVTASPVLSGTPVLTGTADNTSSTGTPPASVGATFAALAAGQWQPDPANGRLVFQGTLSDLTHLPAFDENAICAGYIVPQNSGSSVPTGLSGLWRLGGALTQVNLQDAQGAPLGALQSVLLDLDSGRALYALVDDRAYLSSTPAAVTSTPAGAPTSSGTGAGGASPAGNCGPVGNGSLATPTAPASGAATPAPSLVALPWSRLAVDTRDPTSGTPAVRTTLTQAALQGAPAIHPGQWTLWPAAAAPGWSDTLDHYWAGQK